MKKTIYILIAVAIVAVAGYYITSIDESKTPEGLKGQFEKYSQAEIGLEFDYRVGPKGYVVDERMPVDLGEEPVRVIILHRTEDFNTPPPVGGEGAPVMTIAVFNNSQKQFPGVWADANVQYSNINLKTGDVAEAVVGGANAIRYMADGLYASENFVVAHGENIYVITGQFLDQDSDLRRDFVPLVESIRFIPKDGGSMGLRVGKNALNINEQKVGKVATVSFVVLEKGGYVVIHEMSKGAPGKIIGASALLGAGESSNVSVSLSSALEDGKSYIAMLHVDNGDGTFDATSDAPVKSDDMDGAIIMMEFQASVNVNPVAPVSI